MKNCSAPECSNSHYAKGLCHSHWVRFNKYGRLEKIRGIAKLECSVGDCKRISLNKGLCSLHYSRQYRNGNLESKQTGKRKHELYTIWFERKRQNMLSDDWFDFSNFINDIGDRPSKDHYLVRLSEGLFSKDNYKWEQHLRKRDDESFSEWNKRKRESRIFKFPLMESARNLKRKYNLTLNEYNQKLESQKFVCEICSKPETSLDGRTGGTKRLAVDHDHKSGKIRGLLCWSCNTVIGKVEESLELLDAMKTYIVKYKD